MTRPTTTPSTSPSPGPYPRGRTSLGAWLLPVVAIAVALVLTGLNLNGSSLQMLSSDPASDPSLVAGQPREIRSDEYRLTTPQVIGNDRRELPVEPWIGLTRTFLPATSLDVPAAHWTSLFKPRYWAFFVLDGDRAFAWYWWWQLLVGIVGVYWLTYLLTRRTAVAAALAVAVVASPYTGWWSNGPAAEAGPLSAATACALLGMRARSGWAALGWGLLGGWWAVGAVLTLYPPWQISVAWVLVAVIAGTALDRRDGWVRFGQVAAAALAVLVPALLVWARQSAAALQATAGTLYPGNRISEAGGAALHRLLDAPASLWTSTGYWVVRPLTVQPGERAANGTPQLTNHSELASTWLPLPLLVAALVAAGWVLLRRRRGVTEPDSEAEHPPAPAGPWTIGLLAAVEAVLLGWALLPLPSVVGTVTMLNRVPGSRLPLALGLGLVLILGCVSGLLAGRRLPWWLLGLLGAGAVLSVAAMVWATEELNWTRDRGPGLVALVAVTGTVVLGFTLPLTGHRLTAAAGAVVLAGAAGAVYAPINPLTHGLGVLDRDPLVRSLRPYVDDGRTLATVYGDTDLSALVSGSGLQNLAGMTVYPDADVWRKLAPTQEQDWNNYAKYQWVADPTLQLPVIDPSLTTQRRLRINPCAASTRRLGITVSVSATPLTGSCLVLVDTVQRTSGPVYVYRDADG